MENPSPTDPNVLAREIEAIKLRLTAVETVCGIKPVIEPVAVEPVTPVVTTPVTTVPDQSVGPPPTVVTDDKKGPVKEPPVIDKKPDPAPVPPVIDKKPDPAPVPVPPVKPTPAPKPVPVHPSRPPIEFDWGKFAVWFSTKGALYAGLLLLLIGVASLVVWGYQYMGPAFKIGAGLTVAVTMIGGGEWLARKREGMKWYGMGMIGGGYALGYFLIYAMQNIASVKLLDNLLVDSTLLLAWAGGCMLHSLVRKSEEIALLSTLLAFVTISLSPLGFFSVGASAIMAVALALVVVRMNWLKVYALGAAGSYLTYLIFTQPQIHSVQGDSTAGFWLSGAFLGVFWLVYNAVAFFLKPSKDDSPARRYTILGVVALNAVGFVVPSLHAMGTFLPEWRWLFLAATGVAYFGMTKLASMRGLREVSTLVLLLGLQLVTAAVPLKLDPLAVSSVWLLEVAFLVAAGLRFKALPFRWFAAALAAVSALRLVLVDLADPHSASLFGLSFDWRWLIGVVAVASYAFSAWCYKRPSFEALKASYEKNFAYPLYALLAIGAAWTVPFVVAPVALQALIWAVEGLVLVLLGIRAKDSLSREVASIVFLTAAGSLTVNVAAVNLVVLCVVVAIFYLASFAFKWAASSMNPAESRSRHHLYVAAAVVLTFLMTAMRGQHDPLAVALGMAIEAGLVALLGFQLKDSAIRRLGLFGFAPVALSLLVALPGWSWVSVLPIVGILFALHLRYRMGCPADDKTSNTLLDDIGSFFGADENEYVKRIYLVLGQVLLAATFGVLAEPARLPLIWATQFALTVGAGFVLRERFLRLLGGAGFVAVGIALCATTSIWTWTGVLPVVALMLGLHAWYRLGCPPDRDTGTELDKQLSLQLGDSEAMIFRTAYLLGGAITLTAAFNLLLPAAWVGFAYACQSFVAVAAGLLMCDKTYRKVGTAGMVLTGLKLAGTLSLWTWGSVLPVVAMLFLLYFAYWRINEVNLSESTSWLDKRLAAVKSDLAPYVDKVRTGYALAGMVLLTAVFAQLLDSRILAVAWSLEALTFFAMGIALRVKLFRDAGLAVLSLLTLKLLFLDLKDAETIQRILSFIVAGLAWLAVAFGNGWLNRKLAAKPDEASRESAPESGKSDQS